MEIGVIKQESNGVHSVTRLTGKITYEPTEAVKELSWNPNLKQYEVYQPKKQQQWEQLNLEY